VLEVVEPGAQSGDVPPSVAQFIDQAPFRFRWPRPEGLVVGAVGSPDPMVLVEEDDGPADGRDDAIGERLGISE
jgi:hypothetical protein